MDLHKYIECHSCHPDSYMPNNPGPEGHYLWNYTMDNPLEAEKERGYLQCHLWNLSYQDNMEHYKEGRSDTRLCLLSTLWLQGNTELSKEKSREMDFLHSLPSSLWC